MLNFNVNLDGYDETKSGDVITKDGEVLGTWVVDENDLLNFTPNGEQKPIFTMAFVPVFCVEIEKWHASQQGDCTAVCQ